MEECSLELKKAGLAIPKVLEQNRLLLPYHLYQAKRDWKQIAGEQIAKYSYILDFKDKQVIIAVMNPVYMNYLFMYKNKIIEEINSYVGHRAIADVRFVKKGILLSVQKKLRQEQSACSKQYCCQKKSEKGKIFFHGFCPPFHGSIIDTVVPCPGVLSKCSSVL